MVVGILLAVLAPVLSVMWPVYLGLVLLPYGIGLLVATRSNDMAGGMRWVARCALLGAFLLLAALVTQFAVDGTPHPLDVVVGVLALVVALTLSAVHVIARRRAR
jgi:hypothetical protein